MRRSAYKVRDAQRRASAKQYPDPEDPRHGVSAYDALTFHIKSALPRTQMEVIFHDKQDEKGDPFHALLSDLTDKDPCDKSLRFDSRCVSLRVISPSDPPEIVQVHCASSFSEAWAIARADFPAILTIENGYSIDNLEIEEI